MNGVPVGIARRQGPPLASRRSDIKDGIDDVTLGPLGGTSHQALTGIGREEVADKFPLLVGQIPMYRPPC